MRLYAAIQLLGASLVLIFHTAAAADQATRSPTSSVTCTRTITTTQGYAVFTDVDATTISYYDIPLTLITTIAPTTTTVQPPVDFTPIRSQIVAQGYTPSKRDLVGNVVKLLPYGNAVQKSSSHTTTSTGATTSKTSSTKSTKATATSTLKTTTKPSTSCITETVTSYVPTTTNTITLNNIVFRTVTSTETKSVPVATHYAACDASNQLSHIDEYTIDPDYPVLYSRNSVFSPSPYDCCVKAIEGGFRRSGFYFDVNNDNFPSCDLYVDTSAEQPRCAFNGTVIPFYVTPAGTIPYTYTIMNAYCGSWIYAGVEGQPDVMPPRPSS